MMRKTLDKVVKVIEIMVERTIISNTLCNIMLQVCLEGHTVGSG